VFGATVRTAQSLQPEVCLADRFLQKLQYNLANLLTVLAVSILQLLEGGFMGILRDRWLNLSAQC